MDLTGLAQVYASEGPFVTLYLETVSDVPDAAERYDLRWKNLHRELADLGVDAATIEALDAARGGHPEGNTRVLVAAGGKVLLAESLPDRPQTEIVEVSALPRLLPYCRALDMRIPHVLVLADRLGAELLTFTTKQAGAVETETVDTGRHPWHKTGKGGWSTRRYEHTIQNNWEASARDIADAATTLADDTGSPLIIAAGDVRAVTLLGEHLPQRLQDRYVVVPGGRGAEVDTETMHEHVQTALVERAARDNQQVLASFAEERGQQDRAADGIEATIEALRQAQVDILVLRDDVDESRTAYFGPEPLLLASRPGQLKDLGVEAPQEGRMVDVLLRAAAATAAGVTVVPPESPDAPTEGAGALLRYANG